MGKILILFISFVVLCSSIYGQTIKDLNIDFMLRGHIYANSSIVDSIALGGFGGSDNSPKKIDSDVNFFEEGLCLKIDTTTLVSRSGKFNASTLFIGNKSDAISQLDASDRRLNVIDNVFYKVK